MCKEGWDEGVGRARVHAWRAESSGAECAAAPNKRITLPPATRPNESGSAAPCALYTMTTKQLNRSRDRESAHAGRVRCFPPSFPPFSIPLLPKLNAVLCAVWTRTHTLYLSLSLRVPTHLREGRSSEKEKEINKARVGVCFEYQQKLGTSIE